MSNGDKSTASRRGILPFLVPSDFPPASATVQVEFGAQSRRGRRHPVNEDHYLIMRLGRHQETLLTSLPSDVINKRFDEYGYALIVADGMGGTGTGELASRLAIATLSHLVMYFGKWALRVDDQIAQEVMERAERFYRHVDVAMAHQTQVEKVPRLQTSLTAVFGAGRDMFFAHVGHSRAYLLRNMQLMRLTHDHTINRRGHQSHVPVAPLIDVNAAARDLKHILTDTIGMGGSTGPRVDLEHFQLDDQDVVLVCTNGLTDVLDEDHITQVLVSSSSPDEHCRKLVDRAFEVGGDDDVTALVARYHVPE